MVLSIIAYSLSASAAKGSNTLCQMPFWAQRLNRRWLFFPSPKRSGRDAMGRAGMVAPSSLQTNPRGCPMPQVNDLTRCLAALDQDSTLIAVIEMSQSSWLVAGIVPGIARHQVKKLEPDEAALLQLLHRWRAEAARSGRKISRIAVAFGAGRDGGVGWRAGWGGRDVDAQVIHPNSIAVSREHRRAKTDRLDTALLKRAFLGWLRGERDHCQGHCDPDPGRGRRQAAGPRARRAGRRAHPHHQPLQEYIGVARHPRFRTVRHAAAIARRVAVVDPEQVGLGLAVFVSVEAGEHTPEWLHRFSTGVSAMPEVMEFYRMAGDVDYVLRVAVADMAEYDAFYKRLIAAAPMKNVTSRFAMERIKHTTAYPLPMRAFRDRRAIAQEDEE